MLNEIWKTIDEQPKYEVSNLGRIRVKATGLIRKQQKGVTCKGYWNISFYQGHGLPTKNYLVHRLVAKAFIPNPNNLPQVNHIDSNRENNCVDNLEWISISDNLKHSFRSNNRKAPSSGKKSNNSFYSKYHNVCWRKDKQRWVSTVKKDGKRLSGRLFKDEIECAKWSDELIKTHNLQHRTLNFP